MSLISVIVPAYNAAATLDATLRSARAQTHRDIEIIVVDDGSTDETGVIAQRHAAQDARVRFSRIDHEGVSAARNLALSKARGTFIAPLDADDLWHPRKLELQCAALNEAGDDTVLAYSWFVAIDGFDRPLLRARMPTVEGPVFFRHLDFNFIANGSSILVRADAARAIGYDPALSHCEDYKLQLELALRGRFVCVPAFLTGYRKHGCGLSSDTQRMLVAHIAVMNAMRSADRPDAEPVIDRRIAEFEIELARNRLRRKHIAAGMEAMARAFARKPRAAAVHLSREIGKLLPGRSKHYVATPLPERSFPFSDPHAAIGHPIPERRSRRLAPLAVLDAKANYLE